MAHQARPTVLWREGMFLCPQHLQAYSREVNDRIHAAESIGSPGDWGLVSVVIDEEALRRDTFRLVEGEAVFRDGTLASFPSNATVAQREFGELFTGPTLDVNLGIPVVRPGVAGLSESGDHDGARYRAQSQTVFDENLTSAERELDFKLVQARLFFGDEDRTGFDCIPIARLVRKGKPEAYSALSDTYVPPVLACKASSVLVAEIAEISDQLAAQSRDLASRIPQTALLSSLDKGADVAAFVKLQAVNQCVPGVEQVRRQPHLHPFLAYQQLVHAAGSLAIFSDARTVPALETYDHDDLDRCFHRVFAVIRDLIPRSPDVPYDTEPFKDDPSMPGIFRCDIPANWLEAGSTLYLGIRSEQSAEEVVGSARTALKLTSEEDLEHALVAVTELIEIEHMRNPPLAFPKDGVEYFRVSTEGTSRDAWLKITNSRRALLIPTNPSVAAWSFALFAELGR